MVAAFMDFRTSLTEEDQPAASDACIGSEFVDIGDRTYVLRSSSTRQCLSRLRSNFHKPKWTSKWSSVRLENELRRVLSDAFHLRDETEIAAQFNKLIDRLDCSPPQLSVIFPIDGITLARDSEVVIGGVKLFIFNRDTADDAIPHVPASDTGGTLTLEVQQMKALDSIVCAELRVEGDIALARLEADKIAEPVIDFIQMLVALNEPTATRIRITPRARNVSQLPLLVYDDSNRRFEADRSILPPARFNLDSLSISRAEGFGFGPLIACLSKAPIERTEFEKLLLQALHWIASAERQLQYESKLTSYITALDMFFSAQNSPIVRDVSEGVAFIMSSKPEGRSETRGVIIRLYNKRSKISHEGLRNIEDQDVQQIREIVIKFLARLTDMSRRFQTKAELNAWIGELRLSASYDDSISADSADNYTKTPARS
jgi:hypothetical protein